jgi:transcriptional regulator with XRE-family HTH domain
VPDVSGVARELRLAREAAGLTREQMYDQTGLSVSLIDKVERGVVPVSESYVAAAAKVLASFIDVPGMLTRMRDDERKAGVVPSWFRPWVEHEQEATEIRWYEPLLVPGLLQTEGYARALLDDDDLVTARLDRQRILDRATLTVVIHEPVLRQQIGSEDTTREQLTSLATTSRAVVHVLPSDADTRQARDGSFALAIIDGTEVGYVDTAARGFVVDDRAVVSRLRQRWENLLAEALPRRLSQELILKVAETWTARSRGVSPRTAAPTAGAA